MVGSRSQQQTARLVDWRRKHAQAIWSTAGNVYVGGSGEDDRSGTTRRARNPSGGGSLTASGGTLRTGNVLSARRDQSVWRRGRQWN